MSENRLASFPRTSRVVFDGIERRWHHGMQIYLSVQGEPIVNVAVGDAAPGVELSSATLMLWLSSGKPITAAAILRLVDSGELRLDQPACDIVPEFGAMGKQQVTLRQILTHSVGLRPVNVGWPEKSWDEIVAKVCATGIRAGWQPGHQGAYDPHRTWFILGEILQRVYQRSVAEVLRSEVLEPLGMLDTWLAIPESQLARLMPRVGVMFSRQAEELVPTVAHEPQVITRGSPGSSLRGPASDLGKFYEMLLRQGERPDGLRFLSERTSLDMRARQREGFFDDTFQHRVDFGLGLIINSNRYGWETVPYGFGPFAGDDAFGHGGSQSSIGFADPQHQLVVVAIANGSPGEAHHQERNRALTQAIYEDLGLAR